MWNSFFKFKQYFLKGVWALIWRFPGISCVYTEMYMYVSWRCLPEYRSQQLNPVEIRQQCAKRIFSFNLTSTLGCSCLHRVFARFCWISYFMHQTRQTSTKKWMDIWRYFQKIITRIFRNTWFLVYHAKLSPVLLR